MPPKLMPELFCAIQTHFNLRNPHHFANPSKNYVYHGSESISSLGPRIWNLVSDSLKEFDSISSFKKIINRYKMAARNLSVQAM